MGKTLSLTPALRHEYGELFDSCVVRSQYQAEIDQAAKAMIANKDRYKALAATVKVPWTIIAVNHKLECNLKFDRHLHNGDPLGKCTVNVPKGRPKGSPPWTWEQSAADALTEYGKWTDWTVAGALFMLERYNGVGYRLYHPSVLSPYLWSYSTHYLVGKYGSDGVWSPDLKSKQPGTAVLLRRMAEMGESAFVDQPPPGSGSGSGAQPAVVAYASAMPDDPKVVAAGKALQAWLNTHPGIFVKPDGWTGRGTSDAYRAVTGHYLPGDPKG